MLYESHSGLAVVPADCYADAQEPVSCTSTFLAPKSTTFTPKHKYNVFWNVIQDEMQGFSLSSSS